MSFVNDVIIHPYVAVECQQLARTWVNIQPIQLHNDLLLHKNKGKQVENVTCSFGVLCFHLFFIYFMKLQHSYGLLYFLS